MPAPAQAPEIDGSQPLSVAEVAEPGLVETPTVRTPWPELAELNGPGAVADVPSGFPSGIPSDGTSDIWIDDDQVTRPHDALSSAIADELLGEPTALSPQPGAGSEPRKHSVDDVSWDDAGADPVVDRAAPPLSVVPSRSPRPVLPSPVASAAPRRSRPVRSVPAPPPPMPSPSASAPPEAPRSLASIAPRSPRVHRAPSVPAPVRLSSSPSAAPAPPVLANSRPPAGRFVPTQQVSTPMLSEPPAPIASSTAAPVRVFRPPSEAPRAPQVHASVGRAAPTETGLIPTIPPERRRAPSQPKSARGGLLAALAVACFALVAVRGLGVIPGEWPSAGEWASTGISTAATSSGQSTPAQGLLPAPAAVSQPGPALPAGSSALSEPGFGVAAAVEPAARPLADPLANLQVEQLAPLAPEPVVSAPASSSPPVEGVEGAEALAAHAQADAMVEYKKALKARIPRRRGRLAVLHDGGEARVFHGKRLLGTTPGVFALRAGRYRITLKDSDGQRHSRRVRVRTKRTTRMHLHERD